MCTSAAVAQNPFGDFAEPTSDPDYMKVRNDLFYSRCMMTPDDVVTLQGRYPRSAYVQNLLGSSFLRAQRYKDALEAYQRGLDLPSVDDEAEFNLLAGKASALVGLGRHADARAVLDAAIRNHSDESSLYIKRAKVNESLGYLMQADDDYAKAVKCDPKDVEVCLERANFLIRCGRNADAVDFIEDAPVDGRLSEAEAKARLAMGQTPEAVSCFFWAVGSGKVEDFTADYLERVAPGYFKWAMEANFANLKYDPSDEDFIPLKCGMAVRKGRFSEALESYKAYMSDSLASNWLIGKCMAGELSCLLSQRRFSELDAFCDLEAQTDTFLVTTPFFVSVVKRNLGKDMPGLIDKLGDMSADDHLEALLRSGDDSAAGRCVEAASHDLDCGRWASSVLAARAQAYMTLGRVAEAQADAKECLRMYDMRDGSELAMLRAYCYSSKSGKSFMSMCDSISDLRSALLALAVLRSDGERAETIVRRALAYDIHRGELLFAAACVRSQQGRATESVDLLDSAVKEGFYDIDWLRRTPLLADARKSPSFGKLVDKYAKEAKTEKAVETTTVSVPCKMKGGLAQMSGSVNGLNLDIAYDPTVSYACLSKAAATFMEKSGMLKIGNVGGWQFTTIKRVDLGNGVVLRNVDVYVYDMPYALVITPRELLSYGLPSTDKVNSKLTLTQVKF